MKPSYLVRGLPGHPLHPPLTDATIGTYTVATALAIADVTAGPFVLNLIGFGLLTLGGWLGGAVVYVHGMRVLSLVEEPPGRAVAPVAHPEKEEASA